MTIGRDAKSTMRLHDQEASRVHAEIRATELGTQITDLKSSNGTLLNGKKITSSVLHSGDRILIGRTELVFQAERSSDSSADLASLIKMIGRSNEGSSLGSAIVRSMTFVEGSKLLSGQPSFDKPWLNHAVDNLSALYESSEAVITISDMDRLFDRLLELILASIPATRGCIMTKRDSDGQLVPAAMRHRQAMNPNDQITISQTIADHVLKSVEGIIVVNAGADERFRESASVIQQGIREAICVPLRGRHDTLGVVYIDTRGATMPTSELRFTEDHLRLLIAIAHYAALALEDHRFYQAMLESERLAAIGQTMANLSHHIKNIMQGLKSGAYLVDLGITENNHDLLKQGWATVQRNQDRIFTLVMDMLSYSKERVPNLELGDVRDIVNDITDLVGPRAAEHHIELKLEVPNTPVMTMFDADGIHRAVLNIVNNAIEACLEVEHASVTLHLAEHADQAKIVLEIIDTGPGIEADVLPEIFRVFYSTKGSRGTGLGLAVARAIITEHRGDINVESTIGKGTKFHLEIPLQTRLEKPAAQVN
jgi:signal transduction histidine kinase